MPHGAKIARPLRSAALRSLVAAIVLLALTASAAAAASPSISHVKVPRAPLNSAGGKATITFKAKHASKCSLKYTPAIKHLPRSVSCSHGTAHLKLRIPANGSRKVETITVTITAKHGRHSKRKRATLLVLGAPEVAVGQNFACELDNGKVFCWGGNEYGQVGNGKSREPTISDAERGTATRPCRADHRRLGNGCALLATGHVDCWGYNERGGTGIDKPGESWKFPRLRRRRPERRRPDLVEAPAIYGCAVLKSGHIECWGTNYLGQIGDGKWGEIEVPTVTEVSGITNAKEVAGGEKPSALSCAPAPLRAGATTTRRARRQQIRRRIGGHARRGARIDERRADHERL